METNTWQLQDAKSKFSRLVEKALHHKPQFVTRHGADAVVIVSFEDYKKITKPETNLITFFRKSPLVGVDLDISRNKDLPRETSL